MALERLQKALARAGVASRRRIEELVHRGRVTINGEVAQVGDKVDLEVDHVKVDGKRIQALHRPHLYLLLNKPPGYVSTVNDPEKRLTVLDLIPQRLHKALFPVGRLDYDSEGLLLLTTDGEFAQRVAHPSQGCTKLYEVKVKGQPDGPAMARLHKGITLDGRHVAPLWVESFGGPPGRRTGRDNSWYRVALKEGRTRQIREMFFRVGHPVMRLKRTQIGGLTDPFLRLGKFRELEPGEIELLLSGAEPARRAERVSRGRPKVKLEAGADAPAAKEKPAKPAKPAKPVRRRITAPLPEGGAPPVAARKPARPARAAANPAAGKGAPKAAPRARTAREEAASEWQASPPRPSEEWSSSPPPKRPAKPLFEETEFEDRRPSIFYGGDDESWDEPLDAPPSAGGGGRRKAGGEWAAGAAERPRRPARVGRPAGGAGDRAGRPPRSRPGAGRPAGRTSFGDDGPSRPPRARTGAGRPPGRASFDEGGPSRPPRSRAGAGRPPGRAFDSEDGPRPLRPSSRPSRPRNGAGPGAAEGAAGGRPSARPGGGRPGGGSASRPAGRSTDRPKGWRPGSDSPGGGKGRPGGRPSRPGAGGGRPGGKPGGKPRGGAR
jgi:23S rRNA pseudouridine2605 synthase